MEVAAAELIKSNLFRKRMSPAKEFIALFLSYTVLILAVFFFSGKIDEKTLYDRYVIRLEGATFRVTDLERSRGFYSNVLDFTLDAESEDDSLAVIELPGKKWLFLRKDSEQNSTGSSPRPIGTGQIVVRVRNGFDSLHVHLLARSGKKEQPLVADQPEFPRESISEIVKRPWGREFIVSDPDGNRLVFFKPHLRSQTRS